MDPDEIGDLPPEWYTDQPVPEKLLRDLGHLPIVPEEHLSRLPSMGSQGLIHRRRESESLTDIERQTVLFASHGLTDQMIADTLSLSIETIKSRMKRALYVKRAKNRTHLVAICLRDETIS
jgi:DNA-binding NarL/FixJ family response regulator